MRGALKVPAKTKSGLRKPLGEVYGNLETVKKLSRRFRIVSVGDLSTLILLSFGIRPHLAVFDFRYHRRRLEKTRVGILKHEFRNCAAYTNRRGALSQELLKDAPALLKKGGAVVIDGEEDLTALAFMKHADSRTLVVYGQPNEGIVVVRQDRRTKERIARIFKEIENANKSAGRKA